MKPKTTLGYACKHAFQSFNSRDPNKDLITAKITQYFTDGTEKSSIILRENFKRPFYVVQPKYRTFKDKKDYIEINKTKRFDTNQARLASDLSKILHGRPDPNASLDHIKMSPYVFGCQEPAPVIFKQKFYDKWNEIQSKASYSVAAYDIETDVVEEGFGPINMASITFNDRVYWCGRRDFFPEKTDSEIRKKLQESVIEYLDQDYIKRHNVKFEFDLVDTETEVVVNCINAFHRFAPDFIVSWNANFDMEKNERALKRGGIDPKDVYSDPSIPIEYRDYKYFPGREFKRKITGVQTKLRDEERFPVLRAPASWQWFDGMSFYAISRVAGGKKDSYALQATAEREGIPGKLYTKEGSHLLNGSVDWHRHMQTQHPYIYAMYNIQDNFVIEDLNRKTQDYSLALPSLITSSEITSYQSQPSLVSDGLSFICLKNGYVWGTVGRSHSRKETKEDKIKKIVPDRSDWIALLHSELNEDIGIPLFAGLPDWRSRGQRDVTDVDISSGYPSSGIAMNVSNKTTMIEVCEIEGFDRFDFRSLGVNYASSVPANACQLAKAIYDVPDNTDMKEFYLNEVLPFIEKEKQKL